ncbi:putative cysteine protease ATG4-like [Capsicum annuum]|nr:putative cysteine protease ATG4-like [Capsicum annuum]
MCQSSDGSVIKHKHSSYNLRSNMIPKNMNEKSVPVGATQVSKGPNDVIINNVPSTEAYEVGLNIVLDIVNNARLQSIKPQARNPNLAALSNVIDASGCILDKDSEHINPPVVLEFDTFIMVQLEIVIPQPQVSKGPNDVIINNVTSTKAHKVGLNIVSDIVNNAKKKLNSSQLLLDVSSVQAARADNVVQPSEQSSPLPTKKDCWYMESENGVPLEVEKIFVVEEENVDLKNEKKADETPNLSAVKTELFEDVLKRKTSSQYKVSVGGTKKKNKMAKDSASSIGSSTLTHLKKRSIAKSLSFPSRGANADIMKKNIDACIKKLETQHLLKLHLLLKMMRMPVLLLPRQYSNFFMFIISNVTRTSAGFSFRLEERAENLKEFLAKVEERIHAREEEKCNFLAKYKSYNGGFGLTPGSKSHDE